MRARAMAETERHVRLFRNGRNQALRIPREFELEADEAVLRKEGDRLIIEPVRKGRLLAVLASLEPLEETFPDVDDDLAPLDDVDL
jgi:antitoxin VapB